MKKIYFLVSHPIQYYSPLFAYLSQKNEFELKVLYCSDYGADGKSVKKHPKLGEFKTWDIDLLSGYNYEFMKNYSFYDSIFKSFFGAVNLGVLSILRKEKPDLLIVNGWNYFSMVFSLIICKFLRINTAIRGDNSIETDSYNSGIKLFLKKIILSNFLFKLSDFIFYVGESNKLFFKKYGVGDSKLKFLPHAVNNDFFQRKGKLLKLEINDLKLKLGFTKKFNILFIGRLVDQKRPVDLIKSIENVSDVDLHIIGIGPLDKTIISYIEKKSLKNVFLHGFKNQTELPDFFSASDLFVLPSGRGETWGLVVNEAMNFGLPIIVSNVVGCRRDLVKDNGFIVKVGDVKALSDKINLIKDTPQLQRKMGQESLKVINEYSYDKIFINLSNMVLRNEVVNS